MYSSFKWTLWATSGDVDHYIRLSHGCQGEISSKDNITFGIKTWAQIERTFSTK